MMKHGMIAALSLVLAACGASNTPPIASDTAPITPIIHTVYSGGTIYTGIGDQTVEAVVVDPSGRIIAVTAPAAQTESENQVRVIDLDDAVMFPGFVDGHAHLLGIGERELTLDLTGTASIGELVTRVESELEGFEPGRILFGNGWIETGWPEGRMPSAADLDAVSPDHPVILGRADGHALVANSAALALAKITDETGDPSGGMIERGPDGKATGILIDMAMAPMFALLAAPSEADVVKTYTVGAAEYASRGWTGVHNMSVDPAHAPLLETLDREGKMPLRLHNAFDEAGFEIAAKRQYETDTITNRAVKIYMDGALGSRGARLIEPYSDRPETSGLSLMDADELSRVMARASAEDVQLAIHAIGDLANRQILDGMKADGYGADLRWRIEHTQILHADDIARVGALGLIASMQPSHAIGDLKFAPDRLGVERLAGAYAWRDQLDTGAIVVGGSDAPVEVGSPLIEFYAAVARKDLEGYTGEGWHPEQALSREQALALFTSAPAYAAFMEGDLGTIEIGKIADFTVFDRDLMTVPEAEILNAQVVMTVVQGDVIR